MIEQRQRFCPNCERKTLHTRNRFGGGMGCLLTILTLGLFLPVWLIIDLGAKLSPYHCQVCGEKE